MRSCARWRGQIDYYLLKPWRSPDELFHRTLSEFIHEWAQAGSFGPRGQMVSAGARAAHPAVPERRPARLPFPRLRAGRSLLAEAGRDR